MTRTGCPGESAHRARAAINYDQTNRTVLGRSPQDPGRFAGGGDIIAASPGCLEPASPVNGAAAAAWCLRQLSRTHDRDGTGIIKAASNRAPDRAIWFPAGLATGGCVPWWGMISAAAAFVALVGGCAVATALQPTSFNWLASTVSTLTEPGVADRWVTITAFAVTGACGMATALALRPAAPAGRLILAAAGGAAVLVAMNPEHAGGSLTHGLWAAATFTALIAWPVGAWRRGTSVPWGLRPAVSAAGVGALLALLAWYLAELIAKGGMTGLAERAMCVALVGWPLTVVLSCRRLEQR
jgi:hypothetical protein